MINKTENEIMRLWNITNKTEIIPLVSITCVAYNHEQYIEKTLDSFLMQETTFPFEILIHEDVSTDRTKAIIETYEKKFPNIVKPLYQKENQYSKGFNPMALLYPKVQGEFMAFCDGDDYWTDREKLQIQIEEMSKYPDIDMSCHYSSKLFHNVECDDFSKRSHTKLLTMKEAILYDGNLAPTSSLVFRSRIIKNLPNWIYTAPFGDYPMQVFGSKNAGSLYIDRKMSVYRIGEIGSWTTGCNNTEQHFKRIGFIKKFLLSANEITNYEFEKYFLYIIQKNNFNYMKNLSFSHQKREEIFNKNSETFSLKQKILWHLIYKNITINWSFSYFLKNHLKQFIQKWKVWKYTTYNYTLTQINVKMQTK